MIVETFEIGRDRGPRRRAACRIQGWTANAACRPEQKGVIVIGSGERADGDEPIAAGTIFDHNRLQRRPQTTGR